MKTYSLLLFSLLCCVQLCFSQTKAERKEAKKAQEAEAFKNVKTLVESGSYMFEADWAFAQGGARINLIGNPNFLIVDQGHTKGDLPYFGVAQIVNYGGDGGINFDGPAENYTISYNKKKNWVLVKFSTSDKLEGINVILKVLGPESATVSINSNTRNSITYDGKVIEIPEDLKKN
ncbi:DUF4251 domain-containing protein [Formosa sp. S-31]|uniref:DUF4251 domain-containing protein n=1 Tax=Formosa sp. S-31 TaxID=2790949 RepID=UPI003EB9E9EE